MSRNTRVVLLLAVLLGLRCAGGERRPNVLLVTIDTLRADVVGKVGGTPTIDRFLASAARARCARTVAPLTLPAHVSLLSGALPARHGIHDNFTGTVPPPSQRGYRMLQEVLSDEGYRTAAFVSSPVVSAATGLRAGFDRFELAHDEAMRIGYLPATERVEAPIQWIRGHSGQRPWMVWVHLYDLHEPLVPWPGDERRPATAPDADQAGLYEGELRRIDAALGRLLAAVGDNTVVVLVSDHGEGLGDHGEPTHGTLCYASTVDVLLAVRAPGFARGGTIPGPRSVCDVAPTVAASCGAAFDAPDGLPLDGPPHRVVVTESLLAWRLHGWGQCYAATDGRWTLVESAADVELFDRERDGAERDPMQPLGHVAYEPLDRALNAMRALAAPPRDAVGVTLAAPPYAGTRVHASLYLPRPENARMADPRPQLGDEHLWRLASLLDSGRKAREPRTLAYVVQMADEAKGWRGRGAEPWLLAARARLALDALEPDREFVRRAGRDLLHALASGPVDPDLLASALVRQAEGGLPGGLRRLTDAIEGADFAPTPRLTQALVVAHDAMGGR